MGIIKGGIWRVAHLGRENSRRVRMTVGVVVLNPQRTIQAVPAVVGDPTGKS